MMRETLVFGPIFSRRLGASLGINLLPEKGKLCNFDCIYCECGWNRDGRDDTVLPTAAKVRGDLERMLKKLAAEGTRVDSITFSGDGEPTLNPDFPQIIDDTLHLRDEYYPQAKVSVLSNATRVHIPRVFNALRKVDNWNSSTSRRLAMTLIVWWKRSRLSTANSCSRPACCATTNSTRPRRRLLTAC